MQISILVCPIYYANHITMHATKAVFKVSISTDSLTMMKTFFALTCQLTESVGSLLFVQDLILYSCPVLTLDLAHQFASTTCHHDFVSHILVLTMIKKVIFGSPHIHSTSPKLKDTSQPCMATHQLCLTFSMIANEHWSCLIEGLTRTTATKEVRRSTRDSQYSSVKEV